jgi:hypothetical protein
MKVFKKMSGQPTSTSAFKRDKQANGIKIPVGTIIYRWDAMTKLQVVFEVPRNDLDENRVLCNSFELSNPTDVTWFYIEENKPDFLRNWLLVDEYPDPILVGPQGIQGLQGPQGPQGHQGTQGIQGLVGPMDSQIIEQWVGVPQTSASTGYKGQMAFDGTSIYVCIQDNTWVKYDVVTSF